MFDQIKEIESKIPVFKYYNVDDSYNYNKALHKLEIEYIKTNTIFETLTSEEILEMTPYLVNFLSKQNDTTCDYILDCIYKHLKDLNTSDRHYHKIVNLIKANAESLSLQKLKETINFMLFKLQRKSYRKNYSLLCK